MAESEELKSLLVKVKVSEKAGLKLNIQKTQIMATTKIRHYFMANREKEMATHSSVLA